MKILKSLSLMLMFSSIFISCYETPPKPLNPNGDSELAVLMRAMYEDGLQMKEQIQKGKRPSSDIDHSKMLNAEATEPEKVATAEYEAFTQTYLQVLKALEESDKSSTHEVYKVFVDQCKTCHQSMCPGPIVKIDKLYLDAPLTELR